ncbi:acyl-CoA thioester hydrolase/BAAT C-terminal domain-containing protein [Butyrivibrio sp. AD3002]|uniref:acyl-CoA thioester hydrolase/BAAT C-terminal domain-containing protein n=1 Tax=Butyrivibrio sp. AD3002 TaxID=1280670 RepID=UPI0018C96846
MCYSEGSVLLCKRRIRDINSDKDVTPDTIISVENIRGPVLFLSSKKDEVWPSFESACIMEEKLESVSFPYEHKHVAFENIFQRNVLIWMTNKLIFLFQGYTMYIQRRC